MTLLRYVALGIASIGLSYSIYTNLQQNKTSGMQTTTATSNQNCAELARKKENLEELAEDAQPQTCWMGITLGSVVCDSDANVRHYQSHVEELTEFNQQYLSTCGSPYNL